MVVFCPVFKTLGIGQETLNSGCGVDVKEDVRCGAQEGGPGCGLPRLPMHACTSKDGWAAKRRLSGISIPLFLQGWRGVAWRAMAVVAFKSTTIWILEAKVRHHCIQQVVIHACKVWTEMNRWRLTRPQAMLHCLVGGQGHGREKSSLGCNETVTA